MYFGPLQVQVEGLFYGAPMHDVPALCAFFSILITTINFVTSVEVRFYPLYRNYYSLFNDNGSIRDIEQAEDEMLSVLRQELAFNAHKQLITTLLFIVIGSIVLELLPLGFNDTSMGIYRLLCAGYGLYAISNTIMLILLYFEDYAGALLSTFSFAAISIIGTILQILFSQINYYGLGFLAGGLSFYSKLDPSGMVYQKASLLSSVQGALVENKNWESSPDCAIIWSVRKELYMKNNLQLFALVGALLLLLGGCALAGGTETETTETSVQETSDAVSASEPVEKVTSSVEDYQLRDNDAVYEDDDEDSVVTMYLTVREGNSAENTNHTDRSEYLFQILV